MIALVIIVMLISILIVSSVVINYFAKEHNVHYVIMEDIVDENNRLRRINAEQQEYINQLRKSNILLYEQIRRATIQLEKED